MQNPFDNLKKDITNLIIEQLTPVVLSFIYLNKRRHFLPGNAKFKRTQNHKRRKLNG